MDCQGLIVIFLSSRLAWSEQALALPPTSQAGIKVKGNGMLELTAGKAHSASTTECVLFGAPPMPIFGIMRRLYQS